MVSPLRRQICLKPVWRAGCEGWRSEPERSTRRTKHAGLIESCTQGVGVPLQTPLGLLPSPCSEGGLVRGPPAGFGAGPQPPAAFMAPSGYATAHVSFNFFFILQVRMVICSPPERPERGMDEVDPAQMEQMENELGYVFIPRDKDIPRPPGHTPAGDFKWDWQFQIG